MTEPDADKRRRKRRRMFYAALAALIILLLLLLCYCRDQVSVTTLHPLSGAPTLRLGDAVVTGFSGVAAPDAAGTLPPGKSADDLTFINLDGPAARIFDPSDPGFVWNGSYWGMPHRRDVLARESGQVFGVAIDRATYPNIYLAATSVFGLNLVVPDEADQNRTLKRTGKGQPGASFMQGQFGPNGGPGSIWRVDGRTGEVLLFANVMLDGKGSGPAALGNIAYDPVHYQLFVSDLSTGMIHRFSLKGVDLGRYDHGVTGRKAQHLPPIPHDPARLANIADRTFDTEKPETWGFAPAKRQVWGLAVHESRLYYAVAGGDAHEVNDRSVPDKGQIWSVGLTRKGDFDGDPRLEIILPQETRSAPISDIAFTKDGAMIVAQRAIIGTHYSYKALAARGIAHVYRFWPETPDDPKTPSGWYQQAEEYAVGFSKEHRAGNGGVALGYGYTSKGKIDFKDCESAIFFTGDNLRGFRQVANEFQPGEPFKLHGLQISPRVPVRGFNMPPVISYFVNYANKMSSAEESGRLGDVEVYRLGCQAPACVAGPGVVTPSRDKPAMPPPPDTPPPPACVGPDCPPPPLCVGAACPPPPICVGADCPPPPLCVGADCPPPPICVGGDCPPPVSDDPCMEATGEAVCDPQAGGWVYKLTVQDLAGLGMDTITATSTTGGVTVINGPDITVVPAPGILVLSGASPGQTVSIDVCGFNNAARASAKPYDCCRTTLSVSVPAQSCGASAGSAP